ncbi:hypothetical protein T492DRAFT_836624 [Pavlovales sp. CCMP2436]|nr:hypothetical protein T492DRAFT_836624 [Pavlovales sp. CCMP2436]
MPAENRRMRERKQADFRIKTGTCERRTLSRAEAVAYFDAVDRKTLARFGVRTLLEVDVDALHEPPETPTLHSMPHDPTLTLISYAAWRRRDQIVRQLMRGGADPTVRYPGGSVLAGRPEAAALVR